MPSLSLLLGGAGIIAAVAAWGFWERSEAVTYKAEASTLRAANAANLATINTLQVDQVIAQAAAIADAAAQRKLETDRDELLDAARAGGPCDSLDAVIERRRLQLERDRNGDKGNRP